MKEIWKDVVGYEGFYKVSSLGKIKSVDRIIPHRIGNADRKIRGRILSQQNNGKGYLFVNLCKDGKITHTYSHRIVGLAFISNDENKLTINHKNGIKSDNRASNLEWSTYPENLKHAFRTGLRVNIGVPGSLNKTSKLTEKDVLEIRKRYNNGGTTYKKLAKIYGINFSGIGKIVNRESWKHI